MDLQKLKESLDLISQYLSDDEYKRVVSTIAQDYSTMIVNKISNQKE